MRIIVFSDTHGNFSAMHKVFKRNGDCDLFIFLGDGEQDLEQMRKLYLDKKIISVSGNCDICSSAPNENIIDLENGKRIFYTHGNRYGVGYSKDRIFYKAKEVNADIALFGHTHCRFYSYVEGVHLLNPGSAGSPRDGLPASYAFIDILDSGIVVNHVNL